MLSGCNYKATKRGPLLLAVGLMMPLLSGCHTVGYYAQAVHGHCQILHRRQSCEKLLADPDTSPELREKLELTRQLCEFAGEELHLPANGHYREYADLGRPYVVWNVYAARRFSLESKTWWYPIVGRLDYRGYFAGQDAGDCAARLEARGFDAYVEGAEAYSTLGWFRDPLLNTFIHHRESVLAEIIFHELAHQRVFAHGDTEFNEAFATAVGQEAARRWLRHQGDPVAIEQYETILRRNDRFVGLVAETRRKLELIYGDARTADGQLKAARKECEPPTPGIIAAKRRTLDELRRQLEALQSEWGFDAYQDWIDHGLNNAQLNSVATYYALVPAFERLLAQCDFDLERFYASAKNLAELPKTRRHESLRVLAGHGAGRLSGGDQGEGSLGDRP